MFSAVHVEICQCDLVRSLSGSTPVKSVVGASWPSVGEPMSSHCRAKAAFGLRTRTLNIALRAGELHFYEASFIHYYIINLVTKF